MDIKPFSKFYSDKFSMRLMLMYTALLYKKPIKNSVLMNCILENNDVNYFMLQYNLHQLVEKEEFYGFKEDGEYLYRLTENGEEDIKCLKYKIPLVIQKRIEKGVKKQLDSEKPISDVVSDFTPVGDEFLVSMKVLENGIEQFGINTLVTNRDIAEGVAIYLKQNAARLFCNLNEEINAIFEYPKSEQH